MPKAVIMIALGPALWAGPRYFWENQSFGEKLIFPEGDIFLGEINVGSVLRIQIPVRNPFEREIYLFGVQTSCGCVGGRLEKNELKPGEQTFVIVNVKPRGESRQSFSEFISLESSDPEFDLQRVRISGSLHERIALLSDPDFGMVNPEEGGEFEVILGVIGGASHMSALSQCLKSVELNWTGFSGLPVNFPEESFSVTSSGADAILSAKLELMNSSVRGRVQDLAISFEIPEDLGGGKLKIPLSISLVPRVKIEPQAGVDCQLLFDYPEASKKVSLEVTDGTGIHYPVKQGEMHGIEWKMVIPEKASNWDKAAVVLKASEGRGEQNLGNWKLAIPFVLEGKQGNVFLFMRNHGGE